MAEERVQRHLAAVLAADVVGYSGRMESDEAGTMAALKRHMGGLVLPAIAEGGGRVFKTMGDGCIAEFPSVVDAVRCAVAIQRGTVSDGTERLQFRIGVNLGDVVVEGDDLFGDGVNIAARLESEAPAGGILVSGSAYDQLHGKLDIGLDFLGERHLKNIARPVRVYRVALEGAARTTLAPPRSSKRRIAITAVCALVLVAAFGIGAVLWSRALPQSTDNRASLAVLPFANLAGDELTGRLADGLTEDIITDLSRFRDMDVIAHNSTAAYKDKTMDAHAVGFALDVRYVLVGSVQRADDKIRITAQLIDADSNANLWSERWDRPTEDLFAVQSEIAAQLGNRLGGGGVVEDAAHEATLRRRPENLSAYELFLAGRAELIRLSEEGNRAGTRLLEQAVAADPMLARAWVELSIARQSAINYGADPASVLPGALDAARRAIAIDPSDASAHAALARVLGMRGELGASEAEFETALRLNPGDADILAVYSSWATSFGHPERAAEFADHAIRLDPNYPIWQAYDFSYAYFSADRYEDTLRILDRLPKEKYLFYSWVLRAASYAALDRADDASSATKEALAHFPDITIEGFTGTPDWSERERKRLIETMRAAGFPPCAKPDTLANGLQRLPECVSN